MAKDVSKKEMPLHEKLANISAELKAPKSKYNAFGKYHYRSKEDIQEALKPLAVEYGVAIYISESLTETQNHAVIEATAYIEDDSGTISASSYAGVEKAGGMALPQAYGSASSYAGKYAFGDLFGIDDTVDSDGTNDHGNKTSSTPSSKTAATKKQKPTAANIASMKKAVSEGGRSMVEKALNDKYEVTAALRKEILG
jgi:hypothetical protein